MAMLNNHTVHIYIYTDVNMPYEWEVLGYIYISNITQLSK